MEKKRPYLSPTQIDMFTRCGESYRRRYIEKEIIPPGIAMLKGSAVHSGAEVNYKQKMDSRRDLTASDIKEASVAAFESSVKRGYCHTPEEEGRGVRKVLGETKDRTAVMSGLYAEHVSPLHQPVLVEERVLIEIPNSTHDLGGRLDMVDDRDVISDLKTSGRSKRQEDVDTSTQMTVYSAAFRKLFGRPPADMRFEVLVDKKVPEVQVLSSRRTTADYAALANRINAVLKGVRAGVFVPAVPGTWWCSPRFCGFYATCPYVNSKQKEAPNVGLH